MSTPSVRPIREDELPDAVAVVRRAMLSPPASEAELDLVRDFWPLDRCLVASDAAGALCGTSRSFATELTVPGGAFVAAAAVSAVGVLPTHRRQGHFDRLMRAQLADLAERDEPVALLIAAEYPLYGRYGYGPTTEACAVRLDATAARFRQPAVGTTTLVDPKAFVDAMVEVHERSRRRNAGHIAWEPWRTEIRAGVREVHDGEDATRRDAPKVVWRDAAGDVQGVASYALREDWVDNRPQGELTTQVLAAATDEAERELFRYLASVDWVTTVRAGLRPVDHPLPLQLVDGRAALLLDRSDHIWARILDVPAALAARSYATSDSLVLEVDDLLGLAGGRFALDATPYGATCSPTTAPADLSLPVAALSAAYLGGTPWARLAAAGWVDEATPDAVARATSLFAGPRAPWCSSSF